MFVFDRAPEPLDEDIVQRSSTAIHADADASPFRARGEHLGSELHTLVGVEDIGLSQVKCPMAQATQVQQLSLFG